MWLVLCPATDASALWASQGLRARGLDPLEVIQPEGLAQSERWEHRLGAAGVSFEITPADGRRIGNEDLRGVLNRLLAVPDELLLAAHPEDRDYATQELSAFFSSWLHALPPLVINRPTPQGLSGAWRHRSEWVWLAAKAGLPISSYRQSSHEAPDPRDWQGRLVPLDRTVKTVFVIANQVIGQALPRELREGCRRLAKLAETELLGMEFAESLAGRWTFAGATPLPDLGLGGEDLLDALASVFSGREERHP